MSATCIICESGEFVRPKYPKNYRDEDLNKEIFSARRLPDRIHGNIVECSCCGLVFASPLVDPSKLPKLYEESVYTYGDEERHITKTYARYLKMLSKRMDPNAKPWSYLDIGCGNGFMLVAAKKLGFANVYGVEPSTHAIEQADASVRGNIMQGMFSVELVGENRYDAISCFQTLDHIPDPRAFVRECMAALKPGGYVLFINHNIASIAARVLGERCPMIDIEHTYLHTPHTMKLLFGTEGFERIETFPVRNDYPIYMWMRLLPFPKNMKPGLIEWSKKLVLGHAIIPMYPGNLGLIARKPLA